MEADQNVKSADIDDIQDAFDAILFTEDDSVRKGYDEGFRDGQKAGLREGFSLGFSKGAEIALELGFYYGFCQSWLRVLTNPHNFVKDVETAFSECDCLGDSTKTDIERVLSSIQLTEAAVSEKRKIKPLEKLISLIEAFPHTNIKSEDILEQLNTIRAKFKQVCSVLKVDSESGRKEELSF